MLKTFYKNAMPLSAPLAVALLHCRTAHANENAASSLHYYVYVGLFVLTVAALAVGLYVLTRKGNSGIVDPTHYRDLIENISDVVWEIDPSGHYTYLSPQIERITGYSKDEILRQPFPKFSAHPSMAVHINHAAVFASFIKRRTAFNALESWQFTKDGANLVFEISGVPIYEGESFVGYRGVARDVSARKHAQEELQLEKECFQVTLDNIADGVLRTDPQGIVEYINPSARRLLGISESQNIGQHIDALVDTSEHSNSHHLRELIKRATLDNVKVHYVSTSQLYTTHAADSLNVEVRISPIINQYGGNIGTVIVFHDISEIKRITGQIAHQSTHDALTQLYNRAEFERRLDSAIASSKASLTTHVLCYLDLDQFNVINETYGHIAGDELLKQLAQTLLASIRETDVLARLGGDEFGVLLLDCDTSQAQSIANNLCEKIREHRCQWQEHTLQIGVSAGLVLLDKNVTSLSDAFSAADSACFVAKDLGRNRTHLFHAHDTQLVKRHGMMRCLTDIRDALKYDRFTLYCEAFVPLSAQSQQIKHYETLLRMTNGEGKEVSPMTFIPAAERYHLMPEIDRWVIRNTFRTLAQALPQNSNTIYTINLSGQTLSDPKFLAYITSQFDAYPIPATNICFEITETAAISQINSALTLIKALRSMGCKFALDDFGVGLSSFNYLRSLPVQYLKIDGSFVRNIPNDPLDEAMVNTINQIAHIMGLTTIAEFVESAEILDIVQRIGVDYAQGHGVAQTSLLAQIVEENRAS